MQAPPPLRVPLYYDFASTLCYVSHRSLPRLAGELADLAIAFDWSPLDLAQLLGWRRGAPVEDVRRRNALRVAGEAGVEVRVPTTWTDSRRAMAFSLALGPGPSESAWRERVFTAVFEEGRPIERDEDLAPLARELGLEFAPQGCEQGLTELNHRTESARDAEVTGVPTFMLGSWPFGGVQSDETMRLVLARWASRERGLR